MLVQWKPWSTNKEASVKPIFELPILVVILALACPPIVQAQQSNSATHDGHAVEDIDQLQDLLEKGDAATQHELAEEVKTAIDPLAFAVQKNLIEDTDDLVSNPHNYQGRQLVVIGSVVQLFWEYRLKSETGQNKIVVDVDGLNQAGRAKLDAAINRAGFFGRVRARIHGRIERQTSATFELAATELVLIEPTDPTETLVPKRSSLRRRESEDREVANSKGGTASGGNSGAGNSGAGNSGGGNSGGGNSGNDRGKSKGKGKGNK
jgi:uncharacterized membrane protein YgcG